MVCGWVDWYESWGFPGLGLLLKMIRSKSSAKRTVRLFLMRTFTDITLTIPCPDFCPTWPPMVRYPLL